MVLQDLSLSLSLSRGQKMVALVGKNGLGKSILAMLLTGLSWVMGPFKCNIKVVKFCVISPIWIVPHKHQLIQGVPQHPVLFNMSILENVIYSRPDATEEALANTHATEYVLNTTLLLERPLEHVVGRNATRLRCGQRQRIALARAYLANPVFLILDKPNVSLDTDALIPACTDHGKYTNSPLYCFPRTTEIRKETMRQRW
jgi:ATP-binding cassette, subfamily B, bacterial